MATIRVLLVDDHPVIREGLRTVLGQHSDFDVVGDASDAAAAVAAFARLRPDVTLMDMRLPGMDGADAIAAIRRIDPDARILVLTSYDAPTDVQRALSAGARGYLLKAASAEIVLDAVRRVHLGLHALGSDVARQASLNRYLPKLSGREIEVLERVIKGRHNQEIADELDLSLSTVKFHVNQVMEKLGAKDRTEAAMIAVRDGHVRL